MRVSKFLLPVTLTSIAYCSTFASAENVIQVKSSTTDSQRELIDESHRNLRGGVAEDGVKPEEDGDGERRGGGRGGGGGGGGGRPSAGGGNGAMIPHWYPFAYPDSDKKKESLDTWFKKKKYTYEDIKHLKELVRDMPLTNKEKKAIVVAFVKIQSQQPRSTR